MRVRDLMTSPVVTVPMGESLEVAVERMLDRGIGSVVVTENDEPAGIVTETDVLVAGRTTGDPLAEIAIRRTVSRPLVTVSPDRTVRSAVERMREHGVKKLPVVDGLDLVGILTQQDVVYAHPDLIREAIHDEERRDEWES